MEVPPPRQQTVTTTTIFTEPPLPSPPTNSPGDVSSDYRSPSSVNLSALLEEAYRDTEHLRIGLEQARKRAKEAERIQQALETRAAPIPTSVPGTTFGGDSGTIISIGPKEYSILVKDLAPETSNSDLLAVFCNPVLGLRNSQGSKVIRPFLSCKSAKVILDPVTGISRGYGFVRFADEGDQQRAMVEMHGVYCLSRPSEVNIVIMIRI
ncbi:hypothetical protein GALMADRAFT_452421 [Galerina marginata CBS 339.88]|uniref:RRM domain-containing protein n=1 Tax=Galerina marginata (strain CBS 339.88) TaxID=685588 RepID=A0A067T2R8_GALM3|nr:hypothetical protein GALMADRAFT_452421 [Galerina marginata CBS 339.88]